MIVIDKDPEIKESIEFIVSRFGQPTQYIEADSDSLAYLSEIVPKRLIRYWKVLGFSVFHHGLLTITNPLEWQDTVEDWTEGTELESLDNFISIFKGAYGDLELFGIDNGCAANLSPVMGTIIGTLDKAEHGLDIAIRSTFCADIERFDYYDEPCNFEQAYNKLGPLKSNEIYGFVPVIPMGGTNDLDHLQKLDAFAHLSILRQATGDLRSIMEYTDLYK